jgi:phage virion morphogenesis protein
MPDDFAALEPWLEGYLAHLSPERRLAVARKIGTMLRKVNAARIRRNVQPDGSPMPDRRPQHDRHGRLRARKGRMFARLGLLRSMRIRPREDEVQIDFLPRLQQVAEVHHFGLVDAVDKRIPNSIRVRYAQRRLLGFSPDDREAILEAAIRMVEGDGR